MENIGLLMEGFGHILSFNRACERLSGYRAEEVLGTPFWDIYILPDEYDRVRAAFAQLDAGAQVNHNINYWQVRDGRRVLLEWINTAVRHEPRRVGKSNYNIVKILKLVLTILFSYSSYPLRAMAVLGFGVSVLSLLYGAWLVLHRLVQGTVVPGWTTIAVLVSVFAGFIIALLSMIGEYVVRTLNTVSTDQTYHVVKRVRQER